MFLETDERFIFSVATCNYIRYGRGGGQEIKNAICVLGLNMINDKVLLFIRFLYPHICISPYLYILMHISPYPRFPSYTHISGVCHPLALALHPHLCRVEQVSFYPFLVIILISFPCYHMYPWYPHLRWVKQVRQIRLDILKSQRRNLFRPGLLLWAVGSQKPTTQQIISHFPGWSHAWLIPLFPGSSSVCFQNHQSSFSVSRIISQIIPR